MYAYNEYKVEYSYNLDGENSRRKEHDIFHEDTAQKAVDSARRDIEDAGGINPRIECVYVLRNGRYETTEAWD